MQVGSRLQLSQLPEEVPFQKFRQNHQNLTLLVLKAKSEPEFRFREPLKLSLMEKKDKKRFFYNFDHFLAIFGHFLAMYAVLKDLGGF